MYMRGIPKRDCWFQEAIFQRKRENSKVSSNRKDQRVEDLLLHYWNGHDGNEFVGDESIKQETCHIPCYNHYV